MRTFFVSSAFVLINFAASAATLKVEVNRNGFTGPIQVAVATREDGKPPQWSATKTLTGHKSTVSFPDLTEGLYVVLASGPRPLQRLSAKANLGTDGSTLRLSIPRSKTMLRATLAGEPLAGAAIALTHDELRWRTDVETGDDGRFTGELWEPGLYSVSVIRDRTAAPHSVELWISPKPVTIDVPDRHVRGRVLAGGKPLSNAVVMLRSENNESILNVRTHSAPDGRFEFFGVREGTLTLTARAASYLDSDAIRFDLIGSPAQHAIDVELTRGETRAVRVVDTRDAPIAGAMLITSCDGHVKSTSVTNVEGATEAAFPGNVSCAIFVLPKEGSIAIVPVKGSEAIRVRVPEGSSSLRLALKSDAGQVFSGLRLLMRIDGIVVPPEIARLISSRGFSLVTNDEGSISLQRIPTGTYEFWPYRTSGEGQMLYETAMEFAAPISVNVLTGENNATVRFQAR
ncbi:MAG: carboxypeptidase-like regulatory domain-containing protein [Acidobacteriota bacterium]|nr:carboxypeptidase-like regulatory domain-containing protein [Acidobacteriota bacterium]